MNRMDYIQAVVRTRVLEKKLLTKERMNQLAEAEDLSELWKILESTSYAERLAKLTSFHDYEKMFTDELTATYQLMRQMSPDPEIVNIIALKYDYHNLKVYCKEKVLQASLAHLYLSYGSIPIDKLATEDKTKAIISEIEADYKKYEDPQRIDILLDKLYMQAVTKRLENIDMPIFSEYIRAKIDFINIRSVIRLQKQQKSIEFLKEVIIEGGELRADIIIYTLHDSIPIMVQKFRNTEISKSVMRGLEAYEDTGQLTEFEKEMDDYLMEILQKAKSIHFGPEPLLAYLLAKEQEINNLRMIIISKQNKLQTDQIHQRVRDVYV